MGHRRARRRADQAGDAGITKQVQYLGLAFCGAHLLVQPGPVGGLLGEEGQVAEGGEAGLEAHVLPGQRPGVLRLLAEPPAAGVLLVGGIKHRIGVGPDILAERGRPQALRFGPHDGISAVALQLAPIA